MTAAPPVPQRRVGGWSDAFAVRGRGHSLPAGHFIAEEQPAAVARDLAAWLGAAAAPLS